jgi:hypothetical protein
MPAQTNDNEQWKLIAGTEADVRKKIEAAVNGELDLYFLAPQFQGRMFSYVDPRDSGHATEVTPDVVDWAIEPESGEFGGRHFRVLPQYFSGLLSESQVSMLLVSDDGEKRLVAAHPLVLKSKDLWAKYNSSSKNSDNSESGTRYINAVRAVAAIARWSLRETTVSSRYSHLGGKLKVKPLADDIHQWLTEKKIDTSGISNKQLEKLIGDGLKEL